MYYTALPLLGIAGSLLPAAMAAVVNVNLDVTYGTTNQDGASKPSWLINGQTPGPHLVWDEGDTILANVTNNGNAPITIHWHGIEQTGTPWSDGVPGLAQYPIPVGGNFLYNFTLHQSGFHWFHSHYKMQLDDGLKGTIYIRPNPNKPRPFSQISTDATVLTTLQNAEQNANLLNVYDYKHYTADFWMSEWERTDVEQLCIDNIITSGMGQSICPNTTLVNQLATSQQKPMTKKGCMYPNNTLMFPYPDSKPSTVDPNMWFNCNNTKTPLKVFTVKQSDGWTAFNLVNSGALWDLRVSIDSHKMYFFAADGEYTNIQTATSITIPIGERYQFFVKLDQTPGDYVIRTAAVVLPQILTGYAILSYNTAKADPTTLPTSKSPWIDYAGNIINGGTDLVPANLAPYPANPPPQGAADLTLAMNVTRTSEFGWVLNGNSWSEPADNFTPLLMQPSEISTLNSNVYKTYKNGTLVDVIFTITAGNPAVHPPHPMHKHGVKGWFLGSGTGNFPYATIQDAVNAGYKGINMNNPPFRDDFVTPVDLSGKAWAAMRFRSVDPGPWIMHCHIDAHLATGMAVVLLEGPEKLVPGYVPQYYVNKNKPSS
ncbi:Multicopper oxidase [Ceratobasidium sp. AG-Ba]|nr:Multicopper oxidase [Ceratobasidium sp. AG-Ba]QRW06319.1 Multicopper oxidase [Ceratobasidium sp. AG-Ba]